MTKPDPAGEDRQARFLGLFLKHQDDMRAVIGSFIRDRSAAEDVFQEMALTLWKKFDEFDATRSFGAWARGIAVRKVLQRFDRHKRIPLAMDPATIEAVAGAFDAPDVPEPTDLELALKKCLRRLPGKSQALIRMRYDEDLTLQTIADRINSTLDAVNKALSRIRSALRLCVERSLAEVG
ncbi:MAG: sigma-70 family RNA polymerase sigma factor [Kiritimatiellae bacterium]|nr:sigma-70 family RNA polymerase sigma factor [Kiritimatiellia bacterium]